MADLSAIFKSKPSLPSQTISNRSSNNSQKLPTREHSLNATVEFPYTSLSKRRVKAYDSELINQREAKKIMSLFNMEKQATWFQNQNFVEWCIKVLLVGGLIGSVHSLSMISFSVSVSLFVLVALLIGLHHCIFGSSFLRMWVYFSCFGTSAVLSNQIFLLMMSKINPHLSVIFFENCESLIPSVYVAALLSLIFYSLPLLSHENHYSALHNLLYYHRSVVQLFALIYKLKVIIIQTYVFLIAVTFAISLFLLSSNNQFGKLGQLFSNILHPKVLLAEFAAFLWVALVVHFMLRVISSTVSRIAIMSLYNQRNRDTRIPMILQLLKLSPSSRLPISKPSWLTALIRFVKADCFFLQSAQRKVSHEQLGNIHRHALRWFSDLLSSNRQAMNTRITTSKFYHSYFDVFKQFAEAQFASCAISLFELHKDIEHIVTIKGKPKHIYQDLLFWPSVWKRSLMVQKKAVQSCRHLKMVNQIIGLIDVAQLDRQLWSFSLVGRDLQQINEQTGELRNCDSLNSVIRSKMESSFAKTSDVLQR